jgi:hypothetical protein
MIVELSEPLAEELRDTLGQVLGDMSSEIADTDNPAYRRTLESRRQLLRAVLSQLDGSDATITGAPGQDPPT